MTGASGMPSQPKLCNASLNMSLVQTQASLKFFNRNIWWNPIIGSSSACEEKERKVLEPLSTPVGEILARKCLPTLSCILHPSATTAILMQSYKRLGSTRTVIRSVARDGALCSSSELRSTWHLPHVPGEWAMSLEIGTTPSLLWAQDTAVLFLKHSLSMMIISSLCRQMQGFCFRGQGGIPVLNTNQFKNTPSSGDWGKISADAQRALLLPHVWGGAQGTEQLHSSFGGWEWKMGLYAIHRVNTTALWTRWQSTVTISFCCIHNTEYLCLWVTANHSVRDPGQPFKSHRRKQYWVWPQVLSATQN